MKYFHHLWEPQMNPSQIKLKSSTWPDAAVIFTTSGLGNQCRLQTVAADLLSPFPLVSVIMTGAYNNFFRMFDRNTKRDVTLEASRESSKPRAVLKPRRVCAAGGKRRKDDISVDSLDFTKKILHTAWHPNENIIAIAATNNLYIFQDKLNSEMH